MLGVKNFSAVNYWRNGEPYLNKGWQRDKYAVTTDGTDLRIYNNVVARRRGPDSFSWSMCGFDTNTTKQTLWTAGVRLHRRNNNVFCGTLCLEHDTSQLTYAPAIDTFSCYTRYAHPVRARRAPDTRERDVTLDNPTATSRMPIMLERHVHGFRDTLVVRPKGYAIYIPTEAEMTSQAAATIDSCTLSALAYNLCPDGLSTTPRVSSTYCPLHVRIDVRRVNRQIVSIKRVLYTTRMYGEDGGTPLYLRVYSEDLKRGAYNVVKPDFESDEIQSAAEKAGKKLLPKFLMAQARRNDKHG